MGLVNLSILVERIKKKLSGDFITKTDYASSSAGGVIKTDSAYATDITSGGKLKATTKTVEQYSSLSDNAFISKGTLDNVLGGGIGTWTYEDMGTVTQGNKKNFTDMTTALSCKKILIHNYTSDHIVGATLIDLDLMRTAVGSGYSTLTAIKEIIATATSSTTITIENDGLTVQGGGYIVIYFYQ